MLLVYVVLDTVVATIPRMCSVMEFVVSYFF